MRTYGGTASAYGITMGRKNGRVLYAAAFRNTEGDESLAADAPYMLFARWVEGLEFMKTRGR